MAPTPWRPKPPRTFRPAATAIGTIMRAAANENVSAGGTDLSAQIVSGDQNVFGLASGATISGFGPQTSSSGGVAIDATVSGGNAEQVLYSSGMASITTVAIPSSIYRAAALPSRQLDGSNQDLVGGGTAIDTGSMPAAFRG